MPCGAKMTSTPKRHPRKRLISGPEMATLNSTAGLSLASSIIEAPPMGRRIIFLTLTLLRLHVTECATSCISTQTKSSAISRKR